MIWEGLVIFLVIVHDGNDEEHPLLLQATKAAQMIPAKR